MITAITSYFNPAHYASRYRNYCAFEAGMRAAGVPLVTVECALDGDVFEVPHAIGVRAEHPLWFKENLLNIALDHVHTDYVLWIDCDVLFTERYWVEHTLDALNTYDVIQPWALCDDLGPRGELLDRVVSWCATQDTVRHPGFCWAANTDMLRSIGGLLDTMIIGSADQQMASTFARGLFWWSDRGIPSYGYYESIVRWHNRARMTFESVGCADLKIQHLWHGRKVDRDYGARHLILSQEQFDPSVDLARNKHGVLQIVGKPELQRKITDYFGRRAEDNEIA